MCPYGRPKMAAASELSERAQTPLDVGALKPLHAMRWGVARIRALSFRLLPDCLPVTLPNPTWGRQVSRRPYPCAWRPSETSSTRDTRATRSPIAVCSSRSIPTSSTLDTWDTRRSSSRSVAGLTSWSPSVAVSGAGPAQLSVAHRLVTIQPTGLHTAVRAVFAPGCP